MSLVERIDLDRCSAVQLWAALEPDVKLQAARALYAHDWKENPARHEADATIMHAMRFREAAVRQLPVERRAQYLAKSVRPSENLASSLLLAFHLEVRRPLLCAFLDALGIPHENGLISDDQTPAPPAAKKLEAAAKTLYAKFPAGEVETYLTALVVLDRETWGGLAPVIKP